ncbi:CTP_transf_like domain-containing protein [Durusdinium trenchii]|uniref:CTP_transf_like domain-containing protein n=1 Tax=Durusdinium trenchii TaxID=1381693 RepID=A0ABP0L5G1_9DINO
MLMIPMPVQRLIMTCDSGAKEIHSNELLSTLGLQPGNQITVLNSWPTQPAEIVEKLKLAASYPSRNTAAAIARCLTNEDSSVKVSALRALSWMTRHASAHASDVAKLLREDAEEAVAMGVRVMDPRRLPRIQVRNAAAHTLSWLEEAGATYAADVLLFGWNGWKFSASDAFEEMCQSEAAKTRTAAIHSIVKMLENDCGPLPVPAFHKLCCCQISRRNLVRALFDEDVHNVSAAYLTKCVPAFEESDCGDGVQSRLNSLHIIPKDLLELYIHLGEERYSATAAGNQHELELLRFCEDLARKLDGYWPRWHGWQESIDEHPSSVEEAVCAVAVSTVRYLRRRFQEWEATLGAEEVADRVFLEGRELLDSMVELGLLSSHWEVRKAVVEALMVLTFGRHAVLAVARAKESEKRKEVLEVMATFFEKHDLEEALNDDFQRHFQFMYDDWLSDLEDSDKIEDMESDEEWQMRDKHGGYLKSHVSRSGRHHKQHGANSSKAPPAAIARQKKWDRRVRQEEQPKFSESKRKLQKFRRDKEQDRRYKMALGHELLCLSLKFA